MGEEEEEWLRRKKSAVLTYKSLHVPSEPALLYPFVVPFE